VFEELGRDDDVRAIVLATAGKVFCGGADLTGDKPLADESGESETPALYRGAYRLFASKKPVVVAVQGAAVGAGLGLALVGDFRVAAPEARFSANFTTLGFHAGFGITATLPRVVGEQHASLMLLTGRRVKAEDALRYGLVDEIAPLDVVRAAAQRLAGEIATHLDGGTHLLACIRPPDAAAGHDAPDGRQLARAGGALIARVLDRVPVRRLGIAGGDTSSLGVQALDAWGLSYRSEVGPGAPLCRLHSDRACLDGMEIMLKGGQMGTPDVFERLVHGTA